VQGSEDEISYELPQARAFPSQASRPFEVPARHGRQARSTQLQLACGQMTLLPPRFEPRAGKEPVTVWVIRVWEEQGPFGEEPLEWILATSVPTTTLEQGCRADRVVSTSLAGGGLSSMPHKWVPH